MIRTATSADAVQVAALVKGILEKEFPADQAAYAADDLDNLMEAYAGPASAFLVAEEGHRIVGTCGVKAEGRETAILRRLFVESTFRKKGVGAALLKEALALCKKRGFREVVIRTSSRMSQAIRLCASLGFKEEERWALGPVTLIRYHLRLSS